MPTPNNDGFDIRAPRYIDLRQGKLVGGKSVPYSSTAELLATVLSTRRAEGLIMYVKNGIKIEEWWFVGGIADGNLVQKISAGIQSLQQGTNVTIDSTNPLSPIISATSNGIQSIQQGTNVTIDVTDPLNPIVNATAAAIDQDNIMHVVQVSLTDIGKTPSDTDADIQTALAAYIEGMVIPEDEIWYFQLSGFPDGSTGSTPITLKVLSTAFATATNYNNASLLGKDLGIFLNEINRYLEDSEWQFTGTGIEILISGFDATTTTYTLFITPVTIIS